MTENNADSRKQQIREIYRYDEMSNKVLRVDKRFQSTREDPLKDAERSQPKSMRGRISVKDMGMSSLHQSTSDEMQEGKREVETKVKRQQETLQQKKKVISMRSNARKATILDSEDLPTLNYYPTNAENVQTYEEVLEWVVDLLGNDIPHDIIVGTADLLIHTLKEKEEEADGNVEKRREKLQGLLPVNIPPSNFSDLIKTINKITDYNETNAADEERAVAVLADNDSEEDHEGDVVDTLLDEGSNEEEDEGEDEDDGPEESKNFTSEIADILQEKNEETLILAGEKSTTTQNVAIYTVDEFFLRRSLIREIENAEPATIQQLADDIFLELQNNQDRLKVLESNIMKILNFEHLQLAKFITRNRVTIFWGICLARSSESERSQIIQDMVNKGLNDLVEQYNHRGLIESKRKIEELSNDDDSTMVNGKRHKNVGEVPIPSLVDLNAIKFDSGSKLMTVTQVALPEGSFKKVNPNYEEIHIPAPKKPDIDYSLVSISFFPDWARGAFPSGETDTLNAIQSRVFPAAFQKDVNILLCAPTGAGKTNVAMMSILRTISHYINPKTKKLDTGQFKIVYIAPLKALVQEQVREFQRRLAYLGIKVDELTGDSHLRKQQIVDTQLLVSTPEKWDIITRKAGETSSFVQVVRLVIIDEIHLLHDQRGPVIESIVARSLQSKIFENTPRLVGLSATLPNYEDVSRFLRVPKEGLFFFDSSFRPCPLSQQFLGISEKNSLKKLNAMNGACYDKALQAVANDHQVIIFVHSRKETARTASWLKDKFTESGNSEMIRKLDAGSKQILNSESENVQDPHLKRVLRHGIGIHHAGLSRSDRSLSEDLFADGLLQILVSTATLAWGVNLPAHTVIIKGTDLYSPEKGDWEQLSPQDLLQMLGRAGRPRYDTHGEGIIITNQADIQYYLAVLNQQLPIESQFISMLVDNLNAEVVSGNVKTRSDAVNWLSYTYLYVRMLESPDLYNVVDYEDDESLLKYRDSLIHSSLTILHEKNLVVYNAQNGYVEATELGRIASYFYIRHTSMATYSKELSDHATQIDLFRIMAMSDEFRYITVRQEEKKELKELLEKSPIPVKEDIDDPLAKVNILLQSYISRLKFEGFALNADMTFIIQNAGRLLRALYEFALIKRSSLTTKTLLNLCKMVERRMWTANSPLRQFKSCPLEVIRRTEASTLPWLDYLGLQSPAEVGQALRSEKNGKLVYDLMQRFPKLFLKCAVQPLTPSLLKFELEILPDWIWDKKMHGNAEPFVVLVEDTDGERILHSDSLLVKKEYIGQDHIMEFSLQLSPSQQKSLPPNFFITIISERWCHSESQIAVSLQKMRLPKKFPAPTPLLDMALTSTSALQNDAFSGVFKFHLFNKFQSQVFQPLYNSNENIMISATKGSGKTVLAELALLNHWRQNKGRAIYISPYQEKINYLVKNWNERLRNLAGGKSINKLGLDVTLNLRIIAQSHLILATPEQFDVVSRRWRQRKNIQNINLVIYDDAHEVNRGLFGAVYETIISRVTFITNQLEKETRIVALASCIADGRDFGEWIGVNKGNVFNFSPHERIDPIEIHLQAFNNLQNIPYSTPMTKLAFDFAHENSEDPALVFLSTRNACLKVNSIFCSYAEARNWNMLKAVRDDLKIDIDHLQDKYITESLRNGIGIIYKEMDKKDRYVVEKLYKYGALSFLLLTKDCCYNCSISSVAIVLGTQFFEGREYRFIDYSANEVLEMLGTVRKSGSGKVGKALVMTSPKMKEYYKKFLAESLPIESFMYFHLHDLFTTEISSSVIQSKQDCVDLIAYTYFYRRLYANPSFYGVKDTSAYGISAYLTELVENSLQDLQKSSIIEIEEVEEADTEVDEQNELITPLNGCYISSHYNVSFLTMHMFLSSLSGSSTLRDVLETLSRATEFDDIPVREEDLSMVLKLHNRVPLKTSGVIEGNLLATKVFVLLQLYFSRSYIPIDFKPDLKIILKKAIPLINAIIDILSGDGRLNAMTAMDISQMIVQGVWDTDSPLRQVPFFDEETLAKCAEKKVETVYDIMALDDEEREEIMTMDNSKLVVVANFINNFPNIELEYSLDETRPARESEAKTVTVTLTRDDAPETLEVTSEKYPYEKSENWWLILGELSTKEMFAIKKVSLRQEKQNYELEFTLSRGIHQLTIWCVCDSYLDADKEVSFDLDVIE